MKGDSVPSFIIRHIRPNEKLRDAVHRIKVRFEKFCLNKHFITISFNKTTHKQPITQNYLLTTTFREKDFQPSLQIILLSHHSTQRRGMSYSNSST